MIQIVVADDEENVRDIVAKYINKGENEYHVAGCAENGKKALELIEEFQPDIVISDICMPVMDGFELIQELKNRNTRAKTVIISGYNEFEYAKKAIGLGVSGYLLKPFMPDELMKVLDQLKNELEEQSVLECNLKEMQDELEKSKLRKQKEYIAQIIHGNEDAMELMDRGSEAGIDIAADMYCVSIVRCNEERINKNHTYVKLCEQLFVNFKDSYFGSNVKSYVTQISNDEIVVLFTGEFQNEICFRNEIAHGLERICRGGEKYYNMRFQSTIGEICYDIEKIPLSYSQARTIWNGLLDYSEDIVFYKDYALRNENLNTADRLSRPEKEEKELILQIQMDRKEDAIDTMERIFHYYDSYSIDRTNFVNLSLIELLLDIQQVIKNTGSDYSIWDKDERLSSLTELFQSSSLKQIKEIFLNCIIGCCEEISKVNEKQSDKIVCAVKDLVEKNIGNDEFNLDQISQELYFSIHYIRQVFKQKMDENIQEYLIRRRMERAVELLMDEKGYKVVDIAEQTGYKNQRYFATTFRKYYGCTPTEYKNAECRNK